MHARPPRPQPSLGDHSVAAVATPATRRAVLKGGAALAAGALTLRLPAPALGQEAVSPTAEVCVLTPDLTEGPYYLEGQLVRADITEGRPGGPPPDGSPPPGGPGGPGGTPPAQG